MSKYILLIIFISVSITKSAAQDIVLKPKNIIIYFQTVTYSIPQINIPSNVVIYDTYYHKIKSFTIPKEGTYLTLPKIDLIFRVSPMEIGYKPKGEVFYTDELKDSIEIVIDLKGLSSCPLIVRPIFFEQNSYVLDSTALAELKSIKKMLLLMDDSTHCFNAQLHSNIDVLERKNAFELLTNRARVIKEMLMQNNGMNITLFVKNDKYPPIEKPKNDEEHARNRCVSFKVGRVNCGFKDLNIKVEK